MWSRRERRLIPTSINIDNDIYRRDKDLGCDEHNDNPFELLAVAVAELIFEDFEEVFYYGEAFGEEGYALIHFEVAWGMLVRCLLAFQKRGRYVMGR